VSKVEQFLFFPQTCFSVLAIWKIPTQHVDLVQRTHYYVIKM
jgi:hypothetical protein